MIILGIRCSNTDFAFAVLSGSKDHPSVLIADSLNYPKGFTKQKSLKWLHQEICKLIREHKVSGIVIKKADGVTKIKAFEDRVEHEAMAFLAGEDMGVKFITKKGGSTIAKAMGFKGRVHYLRTGLNKKLIDGFDDFSEKLRDAVLAAWSELP